MNQRVCEGVSVRYLHCWLALLTAGCCSTAGAFNPVAEFQKKHPAESKNYEYIHPTSLDIYYILYGTDSGRIVSIATTIKQRFGAMPGVTQYADRVLEQDGDVFRKLDGDFRSLKHAAADGGTLCQYKWSDSKITETGFLVLRQGDIVKRDPWLTENK